MTDLFVDTSGWAAFLVRREPFQVQAVVALRQARRASRHVITTHLVLCELVALLTRPLRVSRAKQIHDLRTIRQANWVEIVPCDPTFDAAVWQFWESRPDKEWSLVDCASFVLMSQRGLTDALASDHHFDQAGFTRLLR